MHAGSAHAKSRTAGSRTRVGAAPRPAAEAVAPRPAAEAAVPGPAGRAAVPGPLAPARGRAAAEVFRSARRCAPGRQHRLSRRSLGPESLRQGPQLVEDLDPLVGVVLAGRGQQLHGRRECLARPRGRAEPCRGVGLEEARHDLPEGVGDAPGGAWGAVRREEVHQRLGIGFGALEEVQRDQADGEQVGGEVGFAAQDLLGREVARSADDVVRLRQPGLAEPHRDAEVGQPQPGAAGAGRLQQDVGGLDVAVDDVLGVHRRQPGQELVQQGADERGRQWAVVAHEVDEGAAGDEVHGEQDLVVVRGPARRGEDVRVVDAQRLLAHEAQQRVGIALLQHLGGHVPAPPVVPGAPDRADSPAADRVGQFVPSREDLTHDCATCSLRPGPPSAWRPGRRCQF
ncbi:hypothetical protein B0E37_06072 [Streptomyces sp. MH192]|nr:hypothetical protein [Streptomyces sp. MH192]MCF0103418.1 hypothetical protein [Streptomyces sp. MH191]